MQAQAAARQTGSKPIIATVYKPSGEAGKERIKERPYGEFEDENFVFGKPLAPKPNPKKYIEPAGSEQAYRPPKKAKPVKDYGKDNPDLEELMLYFNEWARKFRKGDKEGVCVGLVLMPEYRRN